MGAAEGARSGGKARRKRNIARRWIQQSEGMHEPELLSIHQATPSKSRGGRKTMLVERWTRAFHGNDMVQVVDMAANTRSPRENGLTTTS